MARSGRSDLTLAS